uniref:Natural killer cell lectin-like receptor n=1 Tax=Anas zonorhyncha TaxID=75864 RepID=A0A8B9VF78_9AVES
MGKGAQEKNHPDQEEVLNPPRDEEKQSPPDSSPHGMEKKCRRVQQLLAPLCVVLSVLVLALLVALVVVQLQSRSSHPQFSHVCPAMWIGFQSKCYYFSEDESNWKTSLEKCKAMEASLTSIDSQEELVRTGHESQHRLWCGKCVGLDQNPIFPQISPTAKARRRCPGESNSLGWGVSNFTLFSQKLPPYVQMGAVLSFALKWLPFSVKLKNIHISQIKSPSYCRVPIAG